MKTLTIDHRDTATGPVLAVAGDLDYAQAPELRLQVDQVTLAPGQCLVLDLSGLAFCDSTGITALLAARQHALAAEADIVLAGVPANLLRVLTLVGLDQVFTLRPDSSHAS
ncbi:MULTISPECIES: STAS domain-containing protein [Streptomyces]|uniref:Anti-sigma factor antagonist n=1 Tax=Streptomyces koelreuteriae TaxID=2838015 RepID=A0ABX8FK86_9ACTN|nr:MULTISPECIES: STAS domain-containing protein [Streptomyces]QWB21517.1 STAS domain-containing protein [Streptomyces koelreuteriae]UUA04438.1 STAS domain-containing protein [Streptomyces koelreuteriae]UUA12063.1 STAS domain-containing protein [Streptomyces sp. CRCS-T-1]